MDVAPPGYHRHAGPKPRPAFARRANALRQRLAAFATDTAPLAAAVLLTADAPSEIYDHLFARRFACAEGFAALGAGCRTAGRTLYMDGRAALHGAAVTAPDLRGGAALLLAALGAEGVTLLRDPAIFPAVMPICPAICAPLGPIASQKKHKFSTFLPKTGHPPGPYWWILR